MWRLRRGRISRAICRAFLSSGSWDAGLAVCRRHPVALLFALLLLLVTLLLLLRLMLCRRAAAASPCLSIA